MGFDRLPAKIWVSGPIINSRLDAKKPLKQMPVGSVAQILEPSVSTAVFMLSKKPRPYAPLKRRRPGSHLAAFPVGRAERSEKAEGGPGLLPPTTVAPNSSA